MGGGGGGMKLTELGGLSAPQSPRGGRPPRDLRVASLGVEGARLRRAPTILAAFAVLLLASCGPASQQGDTASTTSARASHEGSPVDEADDEALRTPEGGRAPTMQERLVIERLAHTAERVRGLAFERRVESEVQSREAIVAHLTRQLEEETLESSRLVYVALGLLPPDLDVRALLERVLGEQVVGYYDHEADKLVVRDDVMRALGRGRGSAVDEAKVTIVHELVHALQDQRLGLGDLIEEEGPSDPRSAYHAVVEGDATLAMIGYIAQQAGGRLEWITRDPAQLRTMMEQAQASPIPDAELRAAPPIVRETLVASYLDGLVFAATLHGQGGWRAIDEAHRDLPVSTEQILHPELYVAREKPDEVRVPEIAALTDAGLVHHDDDVLGELEMAIYLGQRDESGVNDEAAQGWSGDHLRVYGDGNGGYAVVWFTAWDTENEAREAEAAARAIADALPSAERSSHRVERSGRALLILRHLPPHLHAAVRRSFRDLARGLPPSPPRG